MRVAKAETIIIQQTKEWLKEKLGVNLDELERTERAKCKRSFTSILIKNIPANAKAEELREVFERYGVLKRLEVGPFNTLALAEFDNEKQAKAAMKNLAYHNFKYLMPLYLEYAPLQISQDSKSNKKLREEKKASTEDTPQTENLPEVVLDE